MWRLGEEKKLRMWLLAGLASHTGNVEQGQKWEVGSNSALGLG